MNDLYTVPVIFGMIGTSFAIIWGISTFLLYPYLMNKPRLFVELKSSEKGFSKSQTLIGMSTKNGPISKGFDEDWYIYVYEWNFDLIIINNSEFNAFEIKLLQNKNKPQIEFREKIDFKRALLSHKDLTLSFRISIPVEIQGKDRDNYWNSQPKLFNDLDLLLEYKNPKGKKFYSNYDFRTSETNFVSMKQKAIKSNWIQFK